MQVFAWLDNFRRLIKSSILYSNLKQSWLNIRIVQIDTYWYWNIENLKLCKMLKKERGRGSKETKVGFWIS